MREKLIELIYDYALDIGDVFCDGCGCHPIVGTAINLADHLIANGVTVQQWIPVSERLPELDVDVLAFNGDYIFISQYYISHFGSWDKVGHMCWMKDQYAKNPTHWMPLPEPPKEE